MSKENPSYYAIIPANVRYDKNLSPNAKLLYGELTALTNKEGFAWASNNYFAELYGVHKNTISKWVSELNKNKYIFIEVRQEENGYSRKIYINEKIKTINKKIDTPKRNAEYPINEIVDTPKRNAVDNNTSNITSITTINKLHPDAILLSKNMLDKIIQVNNPTAYKKKLPDINKWAVDIDKMNRIDGYNFNIINNMIDWIYKNDFWSGVILSGNKLRLQASKIEIQMKRDNKGIKKDFDLKTYEETIGMG